MRATKIEDGFHSVYTKQGVVYACRDEHGEWSLQGLRARVYGPSPEYKVVEQTFPSLADALYAVDGN